MFVFIHSICRIPTNRDLKSKHIEESESSSPAATTAPISYTGTSTTSDDYYQTVVINALLGILKDQSLSSQHHTVIEAIMSIFKTQGLKCVTFLPQVRSLLLNFTSTKSSG